MVNKMNFRQIFLIFIVLTLFFHGTKQAGAHVIGYQAINTILKATGNEILLTTQVAFLFDYDSPYREARLRTLTGYFGEAFLIEQNKKSCKATIDNLTIDTKASKSVFSGKYVCPQKVTGLENLKITSFIFNEFFNPYDHFVRFNSQGNVSELIFTQDKQVYPDNVSVRKIKDSNAWESLSNLAIVLKKFIELGIGHILSGVDHILFLIAVVLLLPSFKKITTLVTSFTVAHSITLISSVLGLITVSPKLVEPVIALSIAVMAARNIWILKTKKQVFLKERWAVVFGFGLFHGLGFAGALAQTEIPKQYFFPSLISFNVGIEIGQFMILAVVLPCLILIRKWRFKSYFLYSVSIAITAIALFWSVQRILK